MRVNDELQWKKKRRGMNCFIYPKYDPTNFEHKVEIYKDFFVFLKLAKAREYLPAKIKFSELMAKGKTLLKVKFTKEEAKVKYGKEDIYQTWNP